MLNTQYALGNILRETNYRFFMYNTKSTDILRNVLTVNTMRKTDYHIIFDIIIMILLRL